MKKLNNMKVQPRLILCFVLTVVIASISGILGTVFLIQSDANYSKALVENGFAQGEIGAFNTYLNKGAALVRDVIMLTDQEDIESAQEELASVDQLTQESLDELKVNCKTAEEVELIGVIEENYQAYLEKRVGVVEKGLRNQNEEALALFRTEARPLLTNAQNAASELMDLNVTMGNEVSASLSGKSRVITIMIILVIIVSIASSVVFAVAIARAIATPIRKVQDASARLAEGLLDIDLSMDTEDEIGDMARAFSGAAKMIRAYISDIGRGLAEVASGNFNIRLEEDYKGDFTALAEAIQKITESLSVAMRQINEGSDQVALGAAQMAESAQSLAEGATSQAGAVEELTAMVESVAVVAQDSAEKANEAFEQAKQFELVAESSSREMGELTSAMDNINTTSREIENIIQEIEDIASQTNLLSLNASIEAARAGEAGRGFAVVADQIGKLASDSAKSAVNTRDLISKSIEEIDNGNRITGRTVESLQKVIEGIKLLAEASRNTSQLSASQAETMKQVEQGVEQISEVVQNNSASAQETSATSEELSAQSESLKALVAQFRLLE